MPLESAPFISDLVTTNPPSTDQKSEGAAHLRVIKGAIKATFPNVTGAVNATQAEFNHVTGVTSPIQTQLNAEATTRSNADAAEALTRANADTAETLARINADALLAPRASPTFTGTVVLPATGSGATEAVRKDYADGLAFATTLPAQATNAGKVVTTNGTTASWTDLKTVGGGSLLGAGNIPIVATIIRSARTANTILGLADASTLIDITSGTFTQTFTAAATLASGWFCYIKNSGTGAVTLDPNAAETINGAATFVLSAGASVIVQCDGANFYFPAPASIGDHEIAIHTGNGYGSTNAVIRRFTTTLTSTGTAITYADSATLGAALTINETGLYSIHYSDAAPTGALIFGVSVNSAQLTTSIFSINTANRLAITTISNSNFAVSTSRVVRLTAGDVVRPHTNGTAGITTDSVFFAIRKVGI